MRIKINKLFLYRHRFVLGYAVLILVFGALLFLLPLLTPKGIATDEMRAVVDSSELSMRGVLDGDAVNLPYRLLQKASLGVFGVTMYAIKLPSIIIAGFTAVFIVLLLNRWFRSNVAIISSGIVVLSSAFLFLAGFGTPAIMYLFWLALILWLGSKILGVARPHPMLVVSFVVALTLSLYTPYMIYIAVMVALAALFHPHMRFTIKKFKLAQLIICGALITLIAIPLILASVARPEMLLGLLGSEGSFNYIDNIMVAFAPFFSFGLAYEGVFLSPLLGMATIALLFVGVLASANKLFTSRNTVVSLLVLFAIGVAGLNPHAAMTIIVPVAVLVAAGLESILEKWYSLFPENPYARIFGVLPIVAFTGIIIVSSLMHFVDGYRYTSAVTSQFNNDLSLARDNVPTGAVLLVPADTIEYEFFAIVAREKNWTMQSALPDENNGVVATFGQWPEEIGLPLSQIVTSPKSQNSDRLYIYNK